jgi:hypothetical protein
MTQVVHLVSSQTNIFVKDAKIQMVNLLLNMKRTLDLPELHNLYKERSLTCLYDRETYSGLRIKIPCGGADGASGRKATAIFFPSGKTILAGIRDPADIHQICQVFSQ